MNPASSIAFLFLVLALVGCGVYLRWSKREARLQQLSAELEGSWPEPIPHIMDGRLAAARHLFGESVAWDPDIMTTFDNNYSVRAPWLDIVDRQLRSQNVQADRA